MLPCGSFRFRMARENHRSVVCTCCSERQTRPQSLPRKLSKLELTMARIELEQQNRMPPRLQAEEQQANASETATETPFRQQSGEEKESTSSAENSSLQAHQQGSHLFITVNGQTNVEQAAARAALSLQDRQKLTLLASGDVAVAASIAILQRARKLLEPFEQGLVLQPWPSERPNALNAGDLFINVYYVNQLIMQPRVFVKASKSTNPDALGEVLADKLQGEARHCVVEAAGAEAVTTALRGIVVARKRMLKKRMDTVVMLAEATASDPKHEFIKYMVQQLVCLKVQADEPTKLGPHRTQV